MIFKSKKILTLDQINISDEEAEKIIIKMINKHKNMLEYLKDK